MIAGGGACAVSRQRCGVDVLVRSLGSGGGVGLSERVLSASAHLGVYNQFYLLIAAGVLEPFLSGLNDN